MTSFTEVSDPMKYVSLNYVNMPIAKYAENDLTDITVMLLADKAIVPKIEIQCLARDLYSTVKSKVRSSVISLVPSQLSKKVEIRGKVLDALYRAPSLEKAPSSLAIVELDLIPYEDSRYKNGVEAMHLGEIDKFLRGCQVMSDKYCVDNPVYRFPIIKSHAKSFKLSTQYWTSKSDKNKLYLSVPSFVLGVVSKYCPTALCTKTVEEIEADKGMIEVKESPALW